MYPPKRIIFVITKTIKDMATKTLQRAEIIFPSMDTEVLKSIANRLGWSIKLVEKKNRIDQSLEDAAAGRVYTAKDIDDLMNHLLK